MSTPPTLYQKAPLPKERSSQSAPYLSCALTSFCHFWESLDGLAPFFPEHHLCALKLQNQLQSTNLPLLREDRPGHFTASAFVCDPSLQYTLLTKHKKLGKWLQLGGHADGNADLQQVALKETQEESGIKNITLFDFSTLLLGTFPQGAPFDWDIHGIPQNPRESGHLHYDLRFLFLASMDEPLVISSESTHLKWVRLEEVSQLNTETSIARPIKKIRWLAEQG